MEPAWAAQMVGKGGAAEKYFNSNFNWQGGPGMRAPQRELELHEAGRQWEQGRGPLGMQVHVVVPWPRRPGGSSQAFVLSAPYVLVCTDLHSSAVDRPRPRRNLSEPRRAEGGGGGGGSTIEAAPADTAHPCTPAAGCVHFLFRGSFSKVWQDEKARLGGGLV